MVYEMRMATDGDSLNQISIHTSMQYVPKML
jgi:hypothetical protein